MVISLILNCIIVSMDVFALAAMFLNWDFMGKADGPENKGLSMFRYFTVDSNVLAGIVSLIMAGAEFSVLSGRTAALPAWVFGIKLMSTSAVMLTFVITACFLVPQFEKPLSLYYNSSLFLHLIVPLTAAVSFVFTEPTDLLPFWVTVLGVLPTLIYGIYYIVRVLTHLKDGKPDREYDFYNFLRGNKKKTPAAVITVFLVSYLLSVLLWYGNAAVFARSVIR